MKAAKKMLKQRFEEQKNFTVKATTKRETVVQNKETSQVKPGQEVKLIEQWNESYDEIEELKKVFY